MLKRLSLASLLWCSALVFARADVFSMPSGLTSVQLVTVGNPGNVADSTGYGSVSSIYAIDKYDVTLAQYTQFLNAVAAATDTYGLYDSRMATAYSSFAINRNEASGSFTYSVQGNGNMPVFDVSWGSAARFCNWLQHGQTTGSEGTATTETGAYTLNGAITDTALNAIGRNSGASYFLPSEDQWYKAAYYMGGGANSSYWSYTTRSNSTPSNALSATGANNANYFATAYTDPANLLTPVGTFAASASAYGTYDQNGDVNQWMETVVGDGRVIRGGSYDVPAAAMISSDRAGMAPSLAAYNVSFRIAAVPEPCTSGLLAIGAAGVVLTRRRLSK
jgi:formylglycine-generating enzyme